MSVPLGAEAGDEVGDLGAVAPDLGPGALVVRPRVGVVAVLVREAPLGMLARPCAWARRTAPFDPSPPGDDDDLGAEHLEQLAALDRHVLGQHDLDRVALASCAIMARAMPVLPDDDSRIVWPGPSRPVLLGRLDHRLEGDAVLHRADRVLALDLGEDAHPRVRAQRAHIDQRRVADHVEHRAHHRCHQRNATWDGRLSRPVRRRRTRRWRRRG